MMTKEINDNGHKKLIVVQIPAKNEEKTIFDVISKIPRKINNHLVKVLVLNDNSTDRTKEFSKKAKADYILDIKASKGLGFTFKSGIDYCLRLGADIIVNIDGDNQFNPEDIPKLVKPIIDKKADMVTASRFLNPSLTKNMPLIKKWGNKRYASLINSITDKRFTDVSCGFRAYSREAALRMNLQGDFTYTQEVFIDLVEKGMKIREIPVVVHYFNERKSIISGNLIRYGFKSMRIIGKATRDTKPLTFFGMPGIFAFLLGFIGAFYSLIYYLTHFQTSPIRTLLNASIFFLTFGIILIVLALVADMLKSIKTTDEEILYRLKRHELEGHKSSQI